MRWKRVNLKQGQGPGKIWGHTCNSMGDGRLLYIFGGYGHDGRVTNKVFVFNTVDETWSQPIIKGTPPTSRACHTCTTVGDNLFVFGGTDGKNPLKDLHVLNTSSHTWTSPTIEGDGPEPRKCHSAAFHEARIFIFGGSGKSADDEIFYNDLYWLYTTMVPFYWLRIQTQRPPSPRHSHICSFRSNKMIVVGGEDEHGSHLSDVHIFNEDSRFWNELIVTPLGPARAGHTDMSHLFGEFFTEEKLYVFGGYSNSQHLCNDLHALDVDTGVWTQVITTGNKPSARVYMAGDFLGVRAVLLGGHNERLEALDDMYYLYKPGFLKRFTIHDLYISHEVWKDGLGCLDHMVNRSGNNFDSLVKRWMEESRWIKALRRIEISIKRSREFLKMSRHPFLQYGNQFRKMVFNILKERRTMRLIRLRLERQWAHMALSEVRYEVGILLEKIKSDSGSEHDIRNYAEFRAAKRLFLKYNFRAKYHFYAKLGKEEKMEKFVQKAIKFGLDCTVSQNLGKIVDRKFLSANEVEKLRAEERERQLAAEEEVRRKRAAEEEAERRVENVLTIVHVPSSSRSLSYEEKKEIIDQMAELDHWTYQKK